ncbi:MAG: hypothetical protein NZ522_03690, partial [Chitinophagales bacterium]|nr:hypothetical protein [Chitinophagales bacterium]
TFQNVKRLDKIVYKPVFSYKPTTKFHFLEDFEFGNQFSFTLTKVSDQNVAYGSWCGLLSLVSPSTEVETQSVTPLVLKGGSEAWVEFDYKSDASFEVGIYAGPQKLSKLTLFPKQTWNKFYMNISNEVGTFSGQQFNIFFLLKMPPGKTSANLWIDNLKIISF